MRSAIFLLMTLAGVAFTSCGSPSTPDGGTGGGSGGGATGGGGGGSTGGGTGGGGGGSTAQFTFALSATSVSLGQGSVSTVTATLTRTGDTGPVAFTLSGQPVGVTGAFNPSSVTSDSTQLTLTAATTAVIGSSSLTVQASGTSGVVTATLPLHVTAPVAVLLVDDDGSDNNQGLANPVASASDDLFRNLLTSAAVPFDVFVVTKDANGPNFAALKNYTTIIWYCGSQYGGTANAGTVSSVDEVNLGAFLDQANRKVVLFADEYLYGTPQGATWTASSSTFVSQYVGAVGYAWDSLNHQAYSATGAGPMAGLALSVASDTPVDTYTDPINPATGTDVLFTAMLDPDGLHGVIAAAIATGRKNVGTAGSSKALYFGFPFENVVDVSANSKSAAFAKVLAY